MIKYSIDFVLLNLFVLIISSSINGISQTPTWQEVGNFDSIAVNSIVTNSQGMLYAGTYDGVYRSDEMGKSWNAVNNGLAGKNVNVIALNSNDELFAGTFGGIFYSDDNGASWEKRNNGLNLKLVRTMIIDADDQIFIGASDSAVGIPGSIFMSESAANTWTEIDSGLMGGDLVKDFTSDQGDTVYAVTDGGGIIQSEFLYKWNASASKWEEIFRYPPHFEIFRLIATDGGLFYAGESHGLIRSADNGTSWESAHLYPRTVLSIAAVSDSVLYAGTFYYGVFYSDDAGGTWQPVGLSGKNIIELTFTQDGHLLAGTANHGLFRSEQKVTKIENSKPFPTKFSLKQNYPNPFNPLTTIQYSIPQRTNVSLKVYDLLGNEVAELVNEKQAAGNYTIQFNGTNLASGTYFYRFVTDQFVSVKRMILMK